MAAKKSKKKSPPPFPKILRVKINQNGTFSRDPLKLKHGDFIQILTPPNSAVDIKWKVTVKPGGGSGGPIVIHS
jgi:hypothetical protein